MFFVCIEKIKSCHNDTLFSTRACRPGFISAPMPRANAAKTQFVLSEILSALPDADKIIRIRGTQRLEDASGRMVPRKHVFKLSERAAEKLPLKLVSTWTSGTNLL